MIEPGIRHAKDRIAEIRFGDWTLLRPSGELLKGDRRIRLQDQPLQILEELLARPGELVTREQLIARLWPKQVVDFDTALNAAVRRLRAVLGDEADTPRYIETIPRRGYRFIGRLAEDAHTAAPEPAPIEPSAPAFRSSAGGASDTAQARCGRGAPGRCRRDTHRARYRS